MSPPQAVGAELLAQFDTFLFDADGVLWLAETPVPGAVDAIQKLVDLGKRVFVITNNSTKTLAQYAEKVRKLGFKALTPSNIIGAGVVTAMELAKDPRHETLPVYLIGSPNLATMLAEVGVKSFGVGPDGNFIEHIDVSSPAFAVVTSYDPHFNYVKLTKAVNYLKDPKVDFVVTNEDKTFPTNVPGLVVPGAGCTSLAVRAISGRTPKVMGKPNKAMFEYIDAKFGLDRSKTLMVGDRLDTDIWFGNTNGVKTLLVLTGVNDLSHVVAAKDKPELIPSYYADSVAVLL